MVLQKYSGGNVKGNEDINRIMFPCRKNEENSKKVKDPSKGMEEVNPSRCIYTEE